MYTCPRCDSNEADILCESPIKGCWIMYICPDCTFSWRSTEPETITNPKIYNPRFKVDTSDLSKYQIHPLIAQRRS
jgi:vanillate/4-hydroxybenzoate decarboxylase subunit D